MVSDPRQVFSVALSMDLRVSPRLEACSILEGTKRVPRNGGRK